jgi:hypothetical protein
MRLTLLLVSALTLAAADAGPRLGKYNCYSYGATGKPPLLITSIMLKAGGEYESVNKPGTYSFDAATQTVTWLSGVSKDNKYTGKFEVDAKTHKIRITPRTVCTNTAP